MSTASVFVVPNTWFGVFDEMSDVILQVALDGSYGRDPHSRLGEQDRDVLRSAPRLERMFAYGGWFGYEDAWRCLAPKWRELLIEHNIQHFRSNDLNRRDDWPIIKERFASAVQNCGLQVVVSVPSALLLKSGTDASRKREVFTDVLRQIFEKAPDYVNFALICDAEQDLEREVRAWMQRLKEKSAGHHERIVGVCAMNARKTVQVQAADLVVNLARRQAELWRQEPEAEIDPVLDQVTGGRFRSCYVSQAAFEATDYL